MAKKSKRAVSPKADYMLSEEALNRAIGAAEAFDEDMLEHPFIDANAVLKVRAEKISKEMHAFYQSIGRHRDRIVTEGKKK